MFFFLSIIYIIRALYRDTGAPILPGLSVSNVVVGISCSIFRLFMKIQVLCNEKMS